jgi:xylan 1,4-beta-xylosidase
MLNSPKSRAAAPPLTSPCFSASADVAGKPFPHFWEHTVGSGHVRLALRADWQEQMRRCPDELGFKYVRFHYKGNVTPPRDYDAWATLIRKLAQHWVDDFLRFCRDNQLPADFVSTHHYPTDAFRKPGDDTETQLAESRRSVLKDQATAVKTVMEATDLVEGYSYWTFSDIFEENYFPSVPFHGGFGLLNIHGIAKPAYRAFQLLHELGDTLLPLHGQHETVDAWLIRKQKDVAVLASNFGLPRHPLKEEKISVVLRDIEQPRRVTVRRIDENHANAKKTWQQIGSPEYLSTADVEKLRKFSKTIEEELVYEFHNGILTINVTLPPQGVALITIEAAI